MASFKQLAGFTLIELLVVISLIGIMSSVVLANLNDARAAARDAVRISDMKQIHNAFELFYFNNRRYPGTPEGVNGGGELIGVGNPIDVALRPYLDPVPRDPRHDAGTGQLPTSGALYFYAYDPQHIVYLDVCTTNPVTDGIEDLVGAGAVFGFNRSETLGVVYKVTCSGSNANLDYADYNYALFPQPN